MEERELNSQSSNKLCHDEQVIVVPLIDGMFGATVPSFIWSGAFASLIGVAMLECGGSPPCVSITSFILLKASICQCITLSMVMK